MNKRSFFYFLVSLLSFKGLGLILSSIKRSRGKGGAVSLESFPSETIFLVESSDPVANVATLSVVKLNGRDPETHARRVFKESGSKPTLVDLSKYPKGPEGTIYRLVEYTQRGVSKGFSLIPLGTIKPTVA
jgi:hypothetical protein